VEIYAERFAPAQQPEVKVLLVDSESEVVVEVIRQASEPSSNIQGSEEAESQSSGEGQIRFSSGGHWR